MRLFLQRFLRTLDQALSDSQAGIAVGMVAHLALWAEAEGGAGSVARLGLSLVVAHDQAMTTMAFPARMAWIDAGRDDTACIPRLVLCVAEDPPLHPVGAFPIAPARICALLWFESRQVFKNQYACSVLPSKLDNTAAYQVRDLFVNVPDFGPEVGIVLFVLSNDASLRSVACNTSKQFRALCPLPLCHSQ